VRRRVPDRGHPGNHKFYLDRRYAIGMRRAAEGELRLGDRCLGNALALGDCATAPRWQLDASGALRSGARCLAVQDDGTVVGGACEAGAAGRFFLDDEGRLWSGVAPPASEVGDLAHLYCLAADGDQVRARVCGEGDAPSWQLARATMAAPRTGAPSSDPRPTQWIADLDGDLLPDWCVATPDGPLCNLASDGALTPEGVPWSYAFHGVVEGSADDPAAPVALGDVDGDGRADLCIAAEGAIRCGRSLAHGFAPRTVVAQLPPGLQPTELTIEPGPTPGAPRLCAGDAATVACTTEPGELSRRAR